MKKIIIGGAMAVLMSTSAHAGTIGASMAVFDDKFGTLLRNGMEEYANTLESVDLQIEDAQNDVAKQQSQVQNFIAAGVDAIIVQPVDTDATTVISKIAADAGMPLVYVNREPVNVDTLPQTQAFVASNEVDSGTLQTQEVCRLLNGKGKAVVIIGELSNQAARMRTKDIHDVLATDKCKGIEIVEEQTANWQRTQGADLMTNWLSAGFEFDAVIANNDEMAIGAIQALKAAGRPMDSVVVGGIDATDDALAAMAAEELDVSVFQDAIGQGKGSIDAALKLAKGEPVKKKIYIPFELVTKENLAKFQGKN
ncbi:sugar ABC transporter substrate-binding protein [Rhizobium pisi]|uniref:Putative rhizopine periplasmic transport protein MocB n=1 Tax=Rhizobium leguminosarum bv. viciae TaxID=387 RepID=O85774_RHILV|nr:MULTISPECIES: sugar ABC transporter substrate-binding protein [Rhizobium]AAC31184.1 putative rhizopine periplasmic transport protein MocB precursor [Rhizobium leguminosarum bv. viciae]MBY5531382.1 sugar ABC transporter substrate-binding protein [Rhizobium leguminosarum]TBY25205.1 sugar ABC transporter substrate-binding protein [Rhizobium leguminosarum bv. viciae]TBY35815.1 sugar ABC transporter substrate-binding protein [Rhizobium leguminosarum bv. viciae]TCA61095.1 sugar ABC transporter su